MDNFIFGQYVPGSSPVHRMNSASKFLLAILFMVMCLWARNGYDYLILFVLILISIKAARVSCELIYHGIKPLILIILLTSLVQLIFDPNGTTLIKLGPLEVTRGGLITSGMIFCRFSLIIIVSTLLTISTPPTELVNGIRFILWPLKYLKVPVGEVSLIISMALRFIPTLYRELMLIIKAQQARGVIFRSGPLFRRVKRIADLIIPLLFSSFDRARKLSYAMLSRGYRTDARRTSLRQNRWSYLDLWAWAVYVIFGTLEIMD